MAYKLTLTANDVTTIAFVGDRYCWSEALSDLEEGENTLTEAEAWEIQDSIEADTDGGHSPYPMLAVGDLMDKLDTLCQEIV